MSESVVRLFFPARADYLLLARLALTGAVRHLNLDDEQLGDLKLAVTEACGNVVRHAYADGDTGPIDLAFILDGDRLVVIVEDQGEGMRATPSHEPDGRADPTSLESGMGMAIIRAIVDEHEIAAGADGRGTIVRLTKYLRTADRQ